MEVAAIIAGLLTVAAAFLAGIPTKLRVISVLVGIGSVAYGIYVLNQSSGIWYFSINLFLFPIILLVLSIKAGQASSTDSRYSQLARSGRGSGSGNVGAASIGPTADHDIGQSDNGSASRRRSLLLLQHP